ncbi:dihydroxyacetone kinase subunit DhaL [Rhizobium ruizarguesonis]
MSENAARQLCTMFQRIATAIEDNKDYLSELDGAIGDGDHGITMSIGFRAVTAEIAKMDIGEVDPSAIMAAAATAFLNAVGASTGPLYAAGFRRAAKALVDAEDMDLPSCAALLRAISTGIAERGKGQRGDKTMLDTWLPATEAAENAVATRDTSQSFWMKVMAAAEAGAASTRAMVAAKGRAARLGDRSLGYVDPGAASAVHILKAIALSFER